MLIETNCLLGQKTDKAEIILRNSWRKFSKVVFILGVKNHARNREKRVQINLFVEPFTTFRPIR